ncbi:MAG: prepilin-type N-terminal cleavage/methylation domain-containing protein [bacterium]|nr:prepilin-type N-terminal cleavage/methylation domain-containing protein [bacterium]MDN5835558.1 prepilin-type N-terminal cleavage/methylation domain-containing protein [bacterium]
MKRWLKNNTTCLKSGFTTVELIVVIVIIAILATIVIVAYPGYQTKINNDTRRSDLSQISAALKAYAQRNNNYIETGSGCGGSSGAGSGWLSLSSAESGSYQTSIVKCLQDAEVLDQDKDYVDPSGCFTSTTNCKTTGTGYMKKNCTLDGKKVIYLLARLMDQPSIDSEISSLCDGGLPWGTQYHVNYYVRVN